MAAISTTPTPPPQPKQAPKILRITLHQKKPNLLSLPRELRDAVWSYALHEPPLYNRHHKPSCVFHSHASAYQIPPPLIHYSPSIIDIRPFTNNWYDVVECRESCIRRKGFGLLMGVCKQIQQEASKVFFAQEKISFAESFVVYRSSQLVVSLRNIPLERLRRVRELALWHPEGYFGIGSSLYSTSSLMEFLREMPQLEDLEVPTALLELLDQGALFELPKLRRVRVFAMRQVQVTDGSRWGSLYVAAGGEWMLPVCACRFRRTREGEVTRLKPVERWCVDCRKTREEMMGFVRDLQMYRSQRRNWTAGVVEKLARIEPAQPGESPYVIRARLDQKRKDHEFHVWGLAIHSAATRAVEARKAERRENLANLVRKAPTLPTFYRVTIDGCDDFAVTGRTIASRQYRAVENRVDHELLLEERENHLKKVAKAEAARRRKEVKKSGKARKRAVEEMKGEKKAAGKRVGRRTL